MSKLKQTASCIVLGMLLCAASVTGSHANSQVAQTPLPGKNIPKFVEPLPTFVGARVPAGAGYTVSMEEFQQKVLPATFYTALPAPFNAGTYVWGYTVGGFGPHYPGVSVEAQKGQSATVTYINNLQKPDGTPPVLQKYLTVDQTLHWADPLMQMGSFAPYAGPVPTVAHLHGAEVPSFYDGGPGQWFTPTGLRGAAYSSLAPAGPNAAIYQYPNKQEATTLWFHDHALGATRLNVYGGMAAFYLLRDAFDTGTPGTGLNLPAGPQEIEMAIQDRMFDTNGQLLFPDLGLNPTVHPFWIPEFFGDTIVVNGKTWPYLNVEPRRYRFRILNGSNARFYLLSLFNKATGLYGPAIWQIGTDGGLLDAPAMLDDPALLNAGLMKPNFFLAPGERADVIVDFSGVAPGTILTLNNDAKAPFPAGATADPQTVGVIMQFRVNLPLTGTDTSFNPAVAGATLRGGANQPPAMVRLVNPVTGTPAVTPQVKRQLTLKEVMGPAGPLEVLVNNTKWNGKREGTSTVIPGSQFLYGDGMAQDTYATELPRVGATEQWEIINLTADAHPIHLHLVQFQLVNRQQFQKNKYLSDWSALFPGGVFVPGYGPPKDYFTANADGALGGNLAVTPYLQQAPVPPNANEAGWKDTIIMRPGEVTRIMVRWTPQDIPVATPATCTAVPGTPGCPGVNTFSFDPTAGPGYVWHCHIIDHEDNEMMRPYRPQI